MYMNTYSMEPKGFSIKIETITSGNSGTEVTLFSLRDLLKNIEQAITSHFVADGNHCQFRPVTRLLIWKNA
jgi:hypothetical protein